jgi:hypothetical protein
MTSLYNINRLVLIIDVDCILWSRTWNFKYSIHEQHGTDIVNPRPITAESRVRSQASPVEIYGGRSGDGTDFPVWRFYLSVSFPNCYILILMHSYQAWEPSKKATFFRTSLDVRQKSTLGVEMCPACTAAWHLGTGFLRCLLSSTKYWV